MILLLIVALAMAGALIFACSETGNRMAGTYPQEVRIRVRAR